MLNKTVWVSVLSKPKSEKTTEQSLVKPEQVFATLSQDKECFISLSRDNKACFVAKVV